MEHMWERLAVSWWAYLQLAFTLAMLVHAYRGGADLFWYFVIFFFQPFGAWIYLVVVFVPGFRLGSGARGGWQRRLSLDELRYRAERAPTVNNRTALAHGLMETGRHAEAKPLLEAVMAMDESYCQAMHDLAICHLACAEPERAVALLKQLLKRDYRWSYYRAWRTLIDAHTACQEPQAALEACRELAKMVPTLEYKCLLAEHLLDNHLKSEAIELLDQALEDNAYRPLSRRLKDWRWARLAQRLLKEAEAG